MGRLKPKAKKSSKGGGLQGVAKKAIGAISGQQDAARRRRRGPAWWANRVLVEKLKRKYNRLKYGGVR